LKKTHEEAIAALSQYHDRLEQAAREGPLRLKQVLADPPAGVGVHEIDLEMRVVRVNAEELRLLGYREDEMVGRPVFEVIVMQEAARRAIEQKLKGEKELRPFVRSFRRKDGSAVALMLMDRLLRDAKGTITGIRTAMTEVAGQSGV
jgi:PAS domain S-box-containing protein